ncbi:Na+/H+ antiporter NhaA [Lysobacter korlensis]|uniref:Na(+)/H(+) antiporter NhaA n=1 Tax=Lysobacter korlensis TaxID=553636 RepID=A0ABV6RM69_9GAMM
MAFLRSERVAAFLLLGAAAVALLIANGPAGPAARDFADAHLGVPGSPFDLSIAHWVTDGLLAIFFFLAAIELKHELTHGELNTPQKALVPTVAAIGGVVVPAGIFLLMVRDPALQDGWPIPTATDIAFALGVLALVGKSLPGRVRALLLALAVIDDLIAILIIAAFFTSDLQPLPLILAAPVVVAFGLLSKRLRGGRGMLLAVLLPLGVLAWVLVFLSGVHATIAGVALGLVMAGSRATPTRHALEPWSNGLILPVFAFFAALVVFPAVSVGQLSPVFWAIVVSLPVGKLLGITGGMVLAGRLAARASRQPVPFGDALVIAGLGGIGFTVSLLMNELAYAGNDEVAVEGTLAVMLGSLIAAVLGIALTLVQARRYARRAFTPSRPTSAR